MRTCVNIVTCNTWLVLFLWASIFYVEHCYYVLYVTLVLFCKKKNHIYFTIFVDKNYLLLIVFFYLYRIIIQFYFPLPHNAWYVQKFCSKTANHVMSKHVSFLAEWFLFSYTLHANEGNMKVILYSWKTLEILPCRIEASVCPHRCSETWI